MSRISVSRALPVAMLLGAAPACAVLAPDSVRDARLNCDTKHDGAACYLAGSQIVEKTGEVNAEAAHLFVRGCTARSSACCDALNGVTGSSRAQVLAEACDGGDLVSCARRANELPATEAGQNEARGILHNACKRSVNVQPGVPAREIEGIGESCASLARMIAAGEGGGRDAVAAAKLEVLAANLRNEALSQHEREDDKQPLPHPAPPKAAPPPRTHARGILDSDDPPADPSADDRARFRREYEARRAAREAWFAAVDASTALDEKKASRGDPNMPAATPFERAFGSGPLRGTSSCQVCTEGCQSMQRCTGDDFMGGRCGYLRTSESAAGASFDTCVAECTSKADSCLKACDCGAR